MGTAVERRRTLLALAWWTDRCPEYASYSAPRLTAGLEDPEPTVRSAAVVSLGALGPYAFEALPALRAARGKGDAQLDHLLAEAAFWIEHGRAWPSDEDCQPLPVMGPRREQATAPVSE